MLDTATAQIAEKLGDMLVCQGFARLEFHNEFTFDKKVCGVIAQNSSILVQYLQCMLLLDLNAGLAKAMSQAILIDFFKVPVPQIAMEGKCSFMDFVTQLEDFSLCFHGALCLLRLFVAISS